MRCFSLIRIFVYSLLIISAIFGYKGVKITRFELPDAVHNGTGPVEMICEYHIGDKENGLIIKWYHNKEQIYQWIPPMAPQDIGIISGLTEYPEENTNRPLSHSIIRLKKVNLAMTGDYTCSVSTFREDDVEEKKMTVYVPDDELNIEANFYNDSHINLTCIAKGARPRPSLAIIVDSQESEHRSIRVENFLYEYYRDYRDYPWIRQEAIVPNFFSPVIILCEIGIPGTGYRKREKLVFYPNKYSKKNNAINNKSSLILFIMLIIIK